MGTDKKRKNPAFSAKKISVAQANPSLAKEAFGWDPAIVSRGSGRKLAWKCKKKGHVWEAVVATRVNGIGCPYCAGQRVTIGENDLKTTHPTIARQANGWDPRSVSAGSGVIQNWICSRKHTWRASTDSRSRGTGCPYCANKKTWPGFNDLQTLYPKIAREAFGWDPKTYGPGSHKRMKWKCKYDHIYTTQVYNRTQGNNCSVCKGNQIMVGVNDLLFTHPRIAKQAHGWDPKSVVAGSNKTLKWKCNRGHIWSAKPNSRTSVNGTGCPYCSGRIKLKGVNDLKTMYPLLARQAYGWSASGIAPMSQKKMKWKCPIGHLYMTSPAKRTTRGAGCPYCSGQNFLQGFNDLKTRFPKLAKEAYGWDPSTVQWGVAKAYKWKCAKSHIFITSPNKRTNGKTGCPTCAVSGFKPNKDAYIYFLRHKKWKMLQIGITNVPKQRLNKHARSGWEEIEIVGPILGNKARKLEKLMLDYLYVTGAIMGPSSQIKTFDGYTEAWIETSSPQRSLTSLIKKAEKYFDLASLIAK